MLHPLQFYSIDKEFDYAKRLDALAGEFTAQGYDGHQLLAELYRNKATFDAVATSLQTALSLTGGAISLAMMASVVGAPLGIAVQLITATLAGIVDLVSQPAIEAMAKKQRNTILAWEKNQGKEKGGEKGGENYFSHQLDVYYQAERTKIGAYTRAEQQNYLFDQVVSDQVVSDQVVSDQVITVHQMTSDAQARELAALTQLAEKSTSGKAYIDVFKQGIADKTKQVSLDSETGVIELGDNEIHQLLIFTQPLLTPGKEARLRSKEGKNKYMTRLRLISQGEGWKIIDKGTADTLADFSNVIQRVRMQDGTTKEIAIHADMGLGNDLIKASEGTMNIRGGAGVDVADYSRLPGAKIQVTARDDGGYLVTKKFSNSKLYTEETIRQQFNYGKRSETIEYRNVLLKTVSHSQASDQLDSVEEIVGSTGDDQMNGGTERDVFYGHDGNDILSGAEGDDVLRGGRGHDKMYGGFGDDRITQHIADEEDFFCGGEGIDTVDYSATQFKATAQNAIGIDIDLAIMGEDGGETVKYLYDSNGKFIKTRKDTFKKIENVIATSLNDILRGDDENNVFEGGSGNDTLESKRGDDTLLGGKGDDLLDGGNGKDKLFGGRGKNILYGGSDDDDIYIESIEGSTLDGGSGEDTLDASLVNPNDKTGLLIHLARNKIAINRPHTEDAPEDIVRNIENVIGTQWNDIIYGNKQDNKLNGGAADDTIHGGKGNDLIFGGDGSDTLFGDTGQDVIYGGRGQDKVHGNAGNDELHQNFGPEGDFLDGGQDDDTVDYSLSFRDEDRTNVQTANKNGIEVCLITGRARRTGTGSGAPEDTLKNIENIKGTCLNDILTGNEHNNLILGGEGDDRINGGHGGNNVLYGGQGNDVLFGSDGHNFLSGDEDNDQLFGGKSNDILSGGKGNDKLIGAEGNDTYCFSLGDGQDVIAEYSGTADDIDVLQFGENIGQQQLWLTRNRDDLVIHILGTQDQITVNQHFKGDQYRLEQIQLYDNQTASYEAIDKLTEEMAKLAAPGSGETTISPGYVSQFAHYWAGGS